MKKLITLTILGLLICLTSCNNTTSNGNQDNSDYWKQTQIYVKKESLNDTKVFFKKADLIAAGENENDFLFLNAYVGKYENITKMTKYEVFDANTNELIRVNNTEKIIPMGVDGLYNTDSAAIINNLVYITSFDLSFDFEKMENSNRKWICYFDNNTSLYFYSNGND